MKTPRIVRLALLSLVVVGVTANLAKPNVEAQKAAQFESGQIIEGTHQVSLTPDQKLALALTKTNSAKIKVGQSVDSVEQLLGTDYQVTESEFGSAQTWGYWDGLGTTHQAKFRSITVSSTNGKVTSKLTTNLK